MEDNEIIKALERISEEDPDGFSSDILNLINRQQAEIERRKNCFNLTYKLDGEQIEKIKNECLEKIELNIEAIKAESIKEFAERLKDKCNKIPQYHFSLLEVEYCIDNLAKEMTGDTE